jgi:hypothetical protein
MVGPLQLVQVGAKRMTRPELPAMDDYSAAHKELSIPDNLNNPADIQVPVQRSAPSASATVAVGGRPGGVASKRGRL